MLQKYVAGQWLRLVSPLQCIFFPDKLLSRSSEIGGTLTKVNSFAQLMH